MLPAAKHKASFVATLRSSFTALPNFFRKFFGGEMIRPYLCRPLKRCRVGQGVKTPPFHGGITGSNPVRGTSQPSKLEGFLFALTGVIVPQDHFCLLDLPGFRLINAQWLATHAQQHNNRLRCSKFNLSFLSPDTIRAALIVTSGQLTPNTCRWVFFQVHNG